jgi:type I restriction enzyme S subunit
MKMNDYVETDIGEFPRDWEVRRLNEIAELQRGLSYSSKEKSKDEIPDGYLFLTLNSVKEGGGLKEDGWTWIKSDRLKERHFVKEGDIVIANTEQSKDGSLLGSPAIVHFPEWYKKDKAVFSMDLSKLLLRISNVDVNFLFYYLSFVQPLARKYHTGTNVWHLKLDSWARDLLIPLPPLEEQKKIVELLQKAADIYYTLKDYIIQIRNSTETIRKVIRKELLTKGIGHNDYVETDIGEFPKDWEVRRLNEIAIIRSGFSERKRDENSKVIHLRPDNIDNETDRIVFHRIVYIPESPKIERYLLRHLDIVLVNTNGSIDHIGKLGIIDMPLNQKITFSNHLTAIRIVSKDVEPYYIYYLLSWYHLNGSFKKVVKNQAGKWNLNLDTIRNLLIPLPPLEEQKKIVELLQKVDELINQFNDFLQNLEEEANTLYKSILRLALTGKLTEDWRRQIILLRSVVIPYLVYQASKIKGRPVYMTELMKYLFLLQKEYNINLAYNFEPYKYGPFTPQLYKDLEELKDRIEVKEVKDDVDKSLITSKELPQVNQDIANAVNDLINRFGNKDLKELLSYVYKKYPEYTVKSELNLYEFLK